MSAHGRKLWAWLTCWTLFPLIFCHGDIHVVQEFGHTQKLLCRRCGKYFAMNDEHQAIIPWDDDAEDFYANSLGFGPTLR
ncbi:MAG: hypothetical protein ABFE07_06965 [Armatimonadia bacterium]